MLPPQTVLPHSFLLFRIPHDQTHLPLNGGGCSPLEKMKGRGWGVTPLPPFASCGRDSQQMEDDRKIPGGEEGYS
jgi:hypothetical protein